MGCTAPAPTSTAQRGWAHHKMHLFGTLLQQFSPAFATRSREIPQEQPSKTNCGYWGCPLHQCSQSCHRYLDPGALVIVAGSPGIHDAMVVEAGKLWPPALEAKEAIVDRGCRELGIGNGSSFHAQENGTAWGGGKERTDWGH